jgi:hypothetical protein
MGVDMSGAPDQHLLEPLLDSWDRNRLALKLAGHAISDDEAGPYTWDVWRNKRREP